MIFTYTFSLSAVIIIVKNQGGIIMSRTGENIYKRKDGRWEGRYIKGHSADGRTQYGYLYGKNYSELRKRLILKKAEVALDLTQNSRSAHVTFYEYSNQWLTSKHPQIKESTFIKYQNMLHSYIWPALGATDISEITHTQMDTFCTQLLSCGGKTHSGLSPKTVQDILTLVRSILQQASYRLDLPSVYTGKYIHIRQTTHTLHVLSRQEQQILYNFTGSSDDLRDIGILVCLLTGLRIGEICALRWEDISFQDKTIHVHQTMQRLSSSGGSDTQKTRVLLDIPKSPCSIRTIPMSELLLHLLLPLQQPLECYFLTGCAHRCIEPRNMQYHFRTVLKRCGIAYVNFHTLRHTFATNCVESGFDIKSLSEILGHSSITITMNRYVHPSQEMKRAGMNRLSELFAVREEYEE